MTTMRDSRNGSPDGVDEPIGREGGGGGKGGLGNEVPERACCKVAMRLVCSCGSEMSNNEVRLRLRASTTVISTTSSTSRDCTVQ